MEKDQEEFLLSAHRSKQGVKSAKDILNKLRSNKEEKTVDTAMVTVSGTSTVAEANSAGNATGTIVPETIKPASGAPGISGIGTFFRKKIGPKGWWQPTSSY